MACIMSNLVNNTFAGAPCSRWGMAVSPSLQLDHMTVMMSTGKKQPHLMAVKDHKPFRDRG